MKSTKYTKNTPFTWEAAHGPVHLRERSRQTVPMHTAKNRGLMKLLLIFGKIGKLSSNALSLSSMNSFFSLSRYRYEAHSIYYISTYFCFSLTSHCDLHWMKERRYEHEAIHEYHKLAGCCCLFFLVFCAVDKRNCRLNDEKKRNKINKTQLCWNFIRRRRKEKKNARQKMK